MDLLSRVKAFIFRLIGVKLLYAVLIFFRALIMCVHVMRLVVFALDVFVSLSYQAPLADDSSLIFRSSANFV